MDAIEAREKTDQANLNIALTLIDKAIAEGREYAQCKLTKYAIKALLEKKFNLEVRYDNEYIVSW